MVHKSDIKLWEVPRRGTVQSSRPTNNYTMGNTETKDQSQDVKQIGDQQVTVIENQEVHTEYHSQHEWKLTVIMIAVLILLALKLLKIAWNFCRKEALKTARSIATIQQV